MKKTKLLTSLAALALVLSLGACAEIDVEEDFGEGDQETEVDGDEDEELEAGYANPAALLEGIADTKNYSMDLTYTEYRTSSTKSSSAQESLTDDERQEWYDTLTYRSSSKWHEEVSEHVYYGRAETRVYGYTGILVWDEESQSWKYDAYDYEYSTYYEILAFDGYAYRQDQSAEEVVRVYIKDDDADWLLYCLWDANGAGGFSGKLHEILHLIPETQDMMSYAYLSEAYPTLTSDIVALGDGHYDIDDTNGAGTGFANASLARLGYQDEIEDYNVALQDSVYDPEAGQWDLNYASDIFISSTRAYQHTYDVSLYGAGTTVPPYDLDSLPELGEDIWYGYGY